MSDMANVIRAHQPTTGMSVASGVTCQCGYWNGEERAGVNRPAGFQGLIWHQGQMLSAAGFGLVREAQAVALEEAADERATRSETLLNTMQNMADSREYEHADIVRYGSYSLEANCTATWLRARAVSLRGGE